MIHYTLSPFRTDPIRGAGYFVPPANAIGGIDLRSLPGHGGTDFMFAALDDSIAAIDADDRVFATAASPVHDLSIAITSKDRTAWADALGVTLGGGIATLADLLAATFLAGDPEGQTALKPLLPNGDFFEIHLGGHSRVWSRPAGKGDAKDPFLAKALACQSADIKRIGDAILRGKLITDALHKAGLPIDKKTAKDVLGIDEEPIKRQTSYTDNFNRTAGNLAGSTASGGGTWSEQEGSAWTTNGTQGVAAASIQDNSARLDSDVSSADHFSQFDYISTSFQGGCGPVVRYSSSAADTFYYAYASIVGSTVQIWKQIAGAHTQVGSSTGHSWSLPDLFRIKVAGSTLTVNIAGSLVKTETDSAITGHTRGGVYAYYETNNIDDFIVDDEVSAGYTLTAAAGSFSLSGQATGLKAGRRIAGDAGAFALTGQPANLIAARKVSADVGAFTLSGQAAALRADRRFAADAGSFTLSGQAAGLFSGRRVTAGAGSFVLSGQAAGLTYSGVTLINSASKGWTMPPRSDYEMPPRDDYEMKPRGDWELSS